MRKINFQRTGVFLCSNEIKTGLPDQLVTNSWQAHNREQAAGHEELFFSSSHDRNTLIGFRSEVVFRVTGNPLVAWTQHQQEVTCKAKNCILLYYLSVGHRCRVGSSWPGSLVLTVRRSHKPRLKSWRSTACTRGSRIYREGGAMGNKPPSQEKEREKRRFQSCSRWLGCCIWFTRKGAGIGWGRQRGHSRVYRWSSWRRKQKPRILRGVRSGLLLRLMKWLA